MLAPEIIGILGIVVLFILIFLGVPIAIGLGVVGFVGYWLVAGFPAAVGTMQSLPFHESYSWTLFVLPMFILLGNFAFHAGIGEEAFRVAEKWLSRIPGGLAIATTAGGAAFGFASGSSLATAAMFGKIAFPEMKKHNYDPRLACGCIAASGTLAALIPPSGLMIIYSIFTEVSLGKILIAGILPGLMTAAIFMGSTVVRVKINPKMAPTIPSSATLKEKVAALKWLGPLIIVIAAILGGIYVGIFTPTEAGAVGAFVTFIIFLVRRIKSIKLIGDVLLDTIGTTAMIFLIIIFAMLFGRFLAVSGLVAGFSGIMLGLTVPPIVIVMIILVIYLILGTFMEVVAMLALTLPIFFPLVVGLGFDGIWFGILAIMMGEIGVLTPPVGTNVYAVKAVVGDEVSLEQVFQGILPYFICYLGAVALLVAFPAIVLWLPGTM